MEPPLGPGATGAGYDSQLGWGRDQANEKELETKLGPAADSELVNVLAKLEQNVVAKTGSQRTAGTKEPSPDIFPQ